MLLLVDEWMRRVPSRNARHPLEKVALAPSVKPDGKFLKVLLSTPA